MRLRPAYAALFFFVSLAIIGGYILDDYGISWDEAIQRRHGRVSLDYAADKLGLDHQALEPTFDLEDYQWSNYGMIYQIAASLLELRWGYDDPYQYYRLRHVINYVLYLLALVCFYRMLRLRWPDRPWYPLLGTILLVLSPRIFAHAFFNPKDHILLVFYLIASFTLLRFLRYRSWPSLMVHALATAIALNTRLPALVILAATVAILVWESVSERKRISRRLGMAGAYAVLSILLMIPFFPYLWEDTLHRLVGALSEMSDFDWGGTNLLFGDRLSAVDVPAYYIPAWIVITTPVMYVLLSLTGTFRALRTIVQGLPRGKLWTDYTGQCDFVHLGLSVGPILVVILLHSTLYNGWRHMHFVYPSLIFLALVGYDGWRQKYPRATAG
ncbi:MAG: glycosyltransferase family 39 protein, partial [Lewinella sp.]